jgi:hypothetical protein
LARWIITAYGAFAIFLGLSLLVARIPSYSTLSKHHAALVAARVGAGLIVVVSIMLWRLVGRIGVETNAAGIGLRRQLGIRYQFVPWGEITAFQIRRAAISPTVCAELRSGELVKTALVQGRKMRWRGGSSRDIVSVLTRDLARARAQ